MCLKCVQNVSNHISRLSMSLQDQLIFPVDGSKIVSKHLDTVWTPFGHLLDILMEVSHAPKSVQKYDSGLDTFWTQ